MRNQRILKNTLALYSRQIIIVLINLYALRVVLNALGVDDFGIYTVVAGFVTLLSFLPGTMASATQRFFAYAIGQQDDLKLKQTFSVNWLLYLAIGLIALLLLQTVGLWFITEELNLPADRRQAAIHAYQLVVLGFVASILASPFIAILVAHEDMHLYALVSVIEAVLKLAAAMLLAQAAGDSLVLYAELLLAIAFITTVIYLGICVKKYPECQFQKIYWDKSQLKEALDFTGWTLFGQLSTVVRNQAVTVLINQLFNPATVAARAIALTVAGQAMVFSQNLNTGLYPPIIKTYAANQKDEMFNLILNGSKLTFFLMWVFALPLMLEIEAILTLWLETPPPEAVLFTQLALIESLIFSFSLPLTTAARAPGKMKLYELSLGSIQVLIFAASWAVLEAGYAASAVFIVAIIANLLMFKVRLLLVKHLIGLPMAPYYLKVLYPLSLVIVLSTLPALLLKQWISAGLLSSAVVVMVSVISATLCTYFYGLDKAWRNKIKAQILSRLAPKGANV